MGTGHPRHQARDFRIIVRHPRHGRSTVISRAQTEHDALLRLGIALGNTYPGTNPAEWITLGIDDPAPFAWSPGQA